MSKKPTAQLGPYSQRVQGLSSRETPNPLHGKVIDGNVVSNAPPPSSPVPNIWIDPWFVVPYMNFGAQLFGFVTCHPDSPALSWAALGAITTFNSLNASATTTRDLHVRVGRKVEMDDLLELGLEAMVAFRLSFGLGPELLELVPHLVTSDASKRWLHTCVRARHLCLPCPEPLPGAVEQLLAASDVTWSTYCGQKKMPH